MLKNNVYLFALEVYAGILAFLFLVMPLTSPLTDCDDGGRSSAADTATDTNCQGRGGDMSPDDSGSSYDEFLADYLDLFT